MNKSSFLWAWPVGQEYFFWALLFEYENKYNLFSAAVEKTAHQNI